MPYPFLTEEVLELSLKDYRQFGNALGQRYAFETDIPKEGYDAVYGAFHCSLVTTASEKDAILLTRVGRADVWALIYRTGTLLDLAGVPRTQVDAGAVPGPGDLHRGPGCGSVSGRKRRHIVPIRLTEKELRHLNRQSNLSGLSCEGLSVP